jgi:hypothetical protein
MLAENRKSDQVAIKGFVTGFAIAAVAWLVRFVITSFYSASILPNAIVTATIWAIVLVSVVVVFMTGLKLKITLSRYQIAFLEGFAALFAVFGITQGMITGNLQF